MDAIVVASLVCVLAALVVLIARTGRGGPRADLESVRESLTARLAEDRTLDETRFAALRDGIEKRLEAVELRLSDSTKVMSERLDNAAKVVSDVKRELGTMEEASRRIFELGKDVASLHNILRSPKARGGVGEFILGDLLAQMIPRDRFALQYTYPDGLKVDAAVFLGDRIVPVDSKFPLENFRRMAEASTDEERKPHRAAFLRDVRKHISDVAEKYIRPDVGTFEFALMYVPAENVYYEAVVRTDADGVDVFSESIAKRVVPVSPNSFFAYLSTIVMGLRGFEIEKQARMIQAGLASVQEGLRNFDESFQVLGKHLNNARSQYEESVRRRARVGDRLDAIAGRQEQGEIEPPQERLLLE